MFGLPVVGAHAVLAGVNEFGAASRQVINNLTAINRATEQLGDVTVSSFTRANTATGISTGAIIRSTGLMSAALAAAAGAFTQFREAANVETTFKTTEALSGATTAQIESLGSAVAELSQQYGKSMSTIAETGQVLNRAGLSLAQVRDGALQAAEALIVASKGELSANDAAIAVAQGLTTFRLRADEANRVVDALANAANGSTASFGDLATSIKYLGTAAAVLSIPIEDASGAIAVMAQNSIRGSTAGTGLRAMLTALEKPTKDSLGLMKQYGISLFDAQGKFLGLRNLVDQLNTAFGDQAVALGKVTEMERANALARIFTTRGASAAIALAIGGTQQFDQAVQQDTTAVAIATKVMESFENQLNRVFSAFSTLTTQALLPLLPALADVARGIADTINQFNPVILTVFAEAVKFVSDSLKAFASSQLVANILNNFRVAFEYAAEGARLAAAAFVTFYEAVIQVPYVLEALQMGLETLPFIIVASAARVLVVAIGAVVAALAPMITTIAAVGAAVMAGIYIWNNWNAIVTEVTNLINTGLAIAMSYLDAGVQAVSDTINSVAIAALMLWQSAIDTVSAAFDAFINSQLGRIIVNIVSFGAAVLQISAILAGAFVIAIGVAVAALVNLGVGIAESAAVLVESTVPAIAYLVQLGEGFVAFAQLVISAMVEMNVAIAQIIANIIENFSAFAAATARNMAAVLSAWSGGWQGMAGIAGQVLQYVADRVTAFFNFLSSLPIIGGFITSVANTFNAGAAAIGDAFSGIGATVQGTIDQVAKGAQDLVDSASTTVQGLAGTAGTALGQMAGDVENRFGQASRSVDGSVRSIQQRIQQALDDVRRLQAEKGLADQRRGERGGSTPSGGRDLGDPSELGFPTPGGGGGGGRKPKEATVLDLSKEIQKLLADIPGMTRQLADFLAGIAKDYPERLTPMVTAIRGAKVEISRALLAKRDLLATTIEIQKVDRNIAMLQAQINAVDIAGRLAVIGYERQLLDLRFQSLQVAKQMWPIQDALTANQRKMRDAQQENLDLAKQINDVNIALLPLQNQLADLEKQISETRREDYSTAKQLAEIEKQMLPIKHMIEDVTNRINQISKEDYGLTQMLLVQQLKMLPIQQRLADIDTQLSRTGRENLKIARERIEAELGIAKQKQLLLEYEQKIANLTDRKGDLTRRQGMLESQNTIASLEDQLTALDAAAEKAALGRDFTGLGNIGRQRDAVQSQLDAANKHLEQQQREADAYERNNELQKIGIELEEQAIIDAITPLEQKIEKLDAITTIEGLEADLRKNSLEQEKRLLEDLLIPLQDQLTIWTNTKELNELWRDIVLAALNQEKSALEDTLKPLQDKYDALVRERDIRNNMNEITRLGLEAEKQRIEDQMKPLQNKLDALERERRAEELRNRDMLIHLEAERRKLVEQLEPLEDVRLAIERQSAEIELQKQAVELHYAALKAKMEEQLLREQLRRADLEVTRLKQEEVFDELILELLTALLKSQAFTTDEAIEVNKRLKLWDEQVTKLHESVLEMQRLDEAADAAKDAINAIPKDITVTITYRYVTIGSPPSGAPGVGRGGQAGDNSPPSGGGDAEGPSGGGGSSGGGGEDSNNPAGPGGVDLGPGTMARLGRGLFDLSATIDKTVDALAGYVNPILSGRMRTPSQTNNPAIRGPFLPPAGIPYVPPSTLGNPKQTVIQQTNVTSYNVDANYKTVQSSASIAADLRAIIALTQ